MEPWSNTLSTCDNYVPNTGIPVDVLDYTDKRLWKYDRKELTWGSGKFSKLQM